MHSEGDKVIEKTEIRMDEWIKGEAGERNCNDCVCLTCYYILLYYFMSPETLKHS